MLSLIKHATTGAKCSAILSPQQGLVAPASAMAMRFECYLRGLLQLLLYMSFAEELLNLI